MTNKNKVEVVFEINRKIYENIKTFRLAVKDFVEAKHITELMVKGVFPFKTECEIDGQITVSVNGVFHTYVTPEIEVTVNITEIPND